MLKDLKKVDGGFEDEKGCFWESKKDYLYVGVLPSCHGQTGKATLSMGAQSAAHG